MTELIDRKHIAATMPLEPIRNLAHAVLDWTQRPMTEYDDAVRVAGWIEKWDNKEAPDLREELADLQHEIWAHWMSYLLSRGHTNPDGSFTIAADDIARWRRQIETKYADLTEREKNSDRDQADKVLELIDA